MSKAISRTPALLSAIALSACVIWLPFGRPVASWISSAVIMLLIVGLVLNRLAGACQIRHLWILLAFAAASVTSAWLSPYAAISLERGAGSLILLTLAFPAAQLAARDAGTLRWLQRAVQATLAITAIDIIWQYATNASLLAGAPAPPDRRRFSGSLPNANEVGFVALLLPLALVAARAQRSGAVPGTKLRARDWCVIVPSVFGALLTGSRTTLGGLFVGACTRSWLGGRRFLRWSLAVVLVVGSVAWAGDLGAFRRRLAETLEPQNEMRLQTWRIAFESFLERPWIGQGPAVFFEINEASRQEARPPGWETPSGGMPWVHNVPLELLTERGVVGMALFGALGVMVVRDVRRGLRDPSTRPWSVGCASSLAAFASMSLLDLTLLKEWCVLCLSISAGIACQSSPSREAAVP